jgi:WXG100 family type VII secretion target
MSDHYTLDINPDELRKASKAISRLAEHAETKGRTVTQTPGEIGDQWTGNAATSIKAEMSGLGRTMTSFTAKLDACKGALDGLADDYDEAKTKLDDLNKRWQQAQTAYNTAVNKADADQRTANQNANAGNKPPSQADLDRISGDHTSAVNAAASARTATLDRLDAEFEDLKTHLETQTRNAGTKIGEHGVPIPVPPSVIAAYQHGSYYPVTLDHGALESSLALTKEFEDKRIDLDIEAKGKQAAEQLMNSRGDIPDALVQEIKEQGGNPYFTYGLASNIDPKQLNAVLSMYDERLTQSGDYSPDEAFRRNSELIQAVGTALGTATQGTGDLQLPLDFQTKWSSAMTEPGWAERDGTAPPNQAQRLGLLMEQGTWGTGFLAGVASDVYDYEHAHQDDHPWSSKAGIERLIGPDGRERLDVMASVMAALGHNPEASQLFFSGGPTTTIDVDGQHVTVSERMKYLVQDRGWSTMTDSTNGGNLGAALKAATAVLRNDEDSGRTSARLASQLFTVVADKTGDGSDDPGPFNDDGWQMWDGMRPAVADIVSSYATDLLRIGRPGSNGDDLDTGYVDPENDLYLQGMPYGAAMNRDVMAKVLGTLSADDENFEKVLAGVAVATNLRMGRAFDKALADGSHPSAPVVMLTGGNLPEVNTASNESASALGWVLNAGYSARLDHDELEAKNAEMRSKMFDAFTAIPGVGPAGDWGKFAFDTVTSEISERIGASDPDTDAKYNALGPGESTKLKETYLNQMLAAGYFDQRYFDEANGPGGHRYPPPPQGAVKPGDPPTFDFDSDAYQDWLRDGFPLDTMLNANVGEPFDSALEDGYQLAGGG